MKKTFDVGGMTCSACSARVEKAVSALDGVDNVSVNLLTNSMSVEYSDNITEENIIRAVTEAGYTAALKGETAAKTQKPKSGEHDMKIRLIGSLICWIPLMYISMHHMFYEWFGIPVPGFVKAAFHGNENIIAFAFSQFLLLLPIMYLNRSYFIHGFKNLAKRSPNMDSLIAIGASAALIYGIYAIFAIGYGLGHSINELVEKYSMDIYFESAATILTLITLGKYLESRSKGKTTEAIEKLLKLAPKTAIVVRDGKEVEIPAEELTVGDIFIVKPGANIPVDGIVVSGSTGIDESAITGESIPVEKSEGDTVIAATTNKTGYIQARATKVGEDTTLNKIIRLVEEASASKAPIAKLADKISGVFVPIVISIAVITMIIWLIAGKSFEFALSCGIAVLVISCPCALGLATPVAIMVGTGKGAQLGILIKSGESLETAHLVDTVVLDKTGTITEGKPSVREIIPLNISENELMHIAASMEKASEHPLAEAIVSYAAENNIEPVNVDEFKAISGKGICARIGDCDYYAGNADFITENCEDAAIPNDKLNALADEGKTPLIFARKDALLGIIAVADSEKSSSIQAVKELKKMKIDTVMLTGDNERTAKAIGKRVGIDRVVAQVLPEDKEREIARLKENGKKVAMVGDGINDAPALVRADVGIAIGAGTDVAIESADIVLMKNSLTDAVSAIQLSRAVIRNIKENLFWAFIYNCIGIPLAAGVFYIPFGIKLNPMFGAAAMSLSSVCVVTNALRLKLFKPKTIKTDVPHGTNKKGQENKMKYDAVINIEGMMCAHCENHVSQALNSIDGVTAEVKQPEGKAYITGSASDEALKKAVTDAGYNVVSIER